MAVTRAQGRIVGEIEELLRIGSYDWRVVEELYEPDARLEQLKRIKLDFIRMKVIGDYVFADEHTVDARADVKREYDAAPLDVGFAEFGGARRLA